MARRVVRERYAAQRPNELSVDKHETLTVIDQSADQWRFAVNAEGENGLVPSNSLYPLGEGPAPAPVPRLIITKAVYDYDATDAADLSFKEDDIVVVVDKVDPGWWRGYRGTELGLFPSNYVEEVGVAGTEDPAQANEKGPVPAPVTGEVYSEPDLWKNRSKKPSLNITARAKYRYQGSREDELSFEEGDIVVVMEKEADGWWKGRCGTRIGWFPFNYVEEYLEDIYKYEDPALHEDWEMEWLNRPSLHITARAKYRYQGSRDKGLSFEEGDKVVVMDKETDGWWKGHCGTRMGWFPFSYVKEVGVAEAAPEKSPPPQRGKFLFGVRANYSFNSGNPEELKFQKGDLLDIIDQPEDDPDWREARKANGQTGLIPRNYVEIVKDAEPVYVSDEDNSKDEVGVAEVTAGKAPPPQQKTFLFGVIAEYSFHSDDPEDLLFQKGDLLDILDQSDNNWWVARNAKGQTGLIPAPYVKVLEDAKPVYVSDEDNSRDDSSEFLREAMKKGYVYVTLVKVLVVGPAGVGKTSILYLLLSKDPPEKRTSTGCAERSVRVIRIGNESGKWTEIPTKEFEKLIAEAVPILYRDLKEKGMGASKLAEVVSNVIGESKEGEKEEQGDEKKQEEEEVGQMDEKKQEEEEVGQTDEKKQKEEKGGGGEEKEKMPEIKENQPPTSSQGSVVIGNVIQNLTDLVSGGTTSRRLLDMELIYLTDCGGQQAYWDLIPVFTYDTSATLFVHRLCEKLDEHPLNDLYQSGKQVGPSQRATLTTAEAFKTMLRGLHEGGKHSKLIIVGTHKDLAGDCAETPEQKNEKFAAIASPHFNDRIVYTNEGMEEIVFQVNAKNPGSEERKEAAKVRTSIEKGAREHKIPIWWFILQLILEALALKLGREVLTKDECVHVSNSLGFSEGELEAALAFFDKLNIFFYKKAILPDIVFTNVQVPLEKLSELVEKQYHLLAAMADPTKASNQAMTGNWQKFRDSGILTLDFLKEFQSHYVEGLFSSSDFIALLEKLLIVSQLSETEYFLPAILSMTSESKISACLKLSRSTKIAPLVVKFRTGWAPPGVYCCSVCHLQSHSGWKVVSKPSIKPRSQVTHSQSQLVGAALTDRPHISAHTTDSNAHSPIHRPPIKPPTTTPLPHSQLDGSPVNMPSIKPRTRATDTPPPPPTKPRTRATDTPPPPPTKPRTRATGTPPPPPTKPRTKATDTPPPPPTKPCTRATGTPPPPPTKPHTRATDTPPPPPTKPRTKATDTPPPPPTKPRTRATGTPPPPPTKPRTRATDTPPPPPTKPSTRATDTPPPPPTKPRTRATGTPPPPPTKPRTKATNTPPIHTESDRPPTQPRMQGTSPFPTRHHGVSRNCIEFTKVGRPGTVTFIDNFSFFIVCVNLDTSKMQQDQLTKHCRAIKSEILESVRAALENTHHKDMDTSTTFLCPCCQDVSVVTQLHVADLSDDRKQWICSKNSAVFDNLTPEQTLWLKSSDSRTSARRSVESAPVMSDLANRVAAVIPDKWKKVAVQLELSQGEIKAIQKDEDDVFDKFMAVLYQWKKTQSKPFTWSTLVSALHSQSVNEVELADQLYQEFCCL